MNKLSVSEALRFGWETFKKRPGILIGGFVGAMLVSGISSGILTPADEANPGLVGVLMIIASVVIGILIEIGMLTFAIRAHDNIEKVEIKDLWNPAPLWWYILGQIAVGLTVLVGFILLVIPGIIAMLGLLFSSYLIVDKKRGPIEAMKESWRITNGHKWQLLLFVLAIVGVNILGILALLVGLLVTVPVSALATVHVYRFLEHKANDMTPASAA